MSVAATIQYLKRDPLHDAEKPYYLYFDYEYDLPRTNTLADYQLVTIHNARDIDTPVDELLQTSGFAKLPIHCPLRPEEYFNPAKVRDHLYPGYASIVHALFPDAVQVKFLEHNVRKRDPDWGMDGRERHEFSTNQPSDYVHIDMTSESARKSGLKKFGIQLERFRRYVVLNFWKPIKGPVLDWPLTVCDRRTVSYSSQTIAMDLVTDNYVNENTRIYHDATHKWYYWEGLRDNEVIVFVQADSQAKDAAGVPHTSFNDPRAPENVEPRQSIETRVYVLF